uniref:Uncharacterized protein n=1 Tax=Ditylenchus dipsaci TaxID=166011 RepID=A0A915D8W7_9BILA
MLRQIKGRLLMKLVVRAKGFNQRTVSPSTIRKRTDKQDSLTSLKPSIKTAKRGQEIARTASSLANERGVQDSESGRHVQLRQDNDHRSGDQL